MRVFDVFNGDADGILALVQLRRADPRPQATLVTGPKRDINLLARVDARAGDMVTVLDISMRSNMEDLKRLLAGGAHVFYADHHNAGDMPEADNLYAAIDTSPETCTSLIIDLILAGSNRAWAVAAAFGDNFAGAARERAAGMDMPLDDLARLGMLINYNSYGASLDDLHFHPAALYGQLLPFATPMDFMAGNRAVYDKLDQGFEADWAKAQSAKALDDTPSGLIIALPDAASSRRISGVYGNKLAQDDPARAHAVLTRKQGAGKNDGWLVSVRAPLNNRSGADTLCLKFDTGGGRAAAAGINHLPDSDLPRFIEAFRAAFKN